MEGKKEKKWKEKKECWLAQDRRGRQEISRVPLPQGQRCPLREPEETHWPQKQLARYEKEVG